MLGVIYVESEENMKKFIQLPRPAVNLFVSGVALIGLAGCLGSSGGGAAGGGGGTASPQTANAFQAQFDRVTGQGPTSDLPTSLSGTYTGALRVDVTDASQTVGEVFGDVNLQVSWADGQTTNPFSGNVDNLRGSIKGEPSGAIEGTLTVDNAMPASISRSVNTINAPIIGPTTLATGAMSVIVTGDLTAAGETVETNLTLGGNFYGPGGTAMAGPVVGGFRTGQTAAIFDGSAAGTFYAEKQ
jgi:hypothetical protein